MQGLSHFQSDVPGPHDDPSACGSESCTELNGILESPNSHDTGIVNAGDRWHDWLCTSRVHQGVVVIV